MIQNLRILIVSCLSLSAFAQAKVVDKIVAIVNDQPITLSDVDKFRRKLQSGGLVDDALLQAHRSTSPAQRTKPRWLNELVDERLIDSEVKRKNMEVTIERVEQEIRSIAGNNNISANNCNRHLLQKA